MWNKKQKQSLELTDVQVSYDYSNGTIKLVSSDPQVKRKPFKLTVASNSPTYKTLFQLLEARGLVDLSRVKLATRLSDTSLLLEDIQNTLVIPVGKTFRDGTVAIDLQKAPHTLIAGGTGSGKSVLQRSIIMRALSQSHVSLRAIDLKKVELSGYAFREQDRFATTYETALELMKEIQHEMNARYRAMEDDGVNNFKDLPYPLHRIYLVIDEVEHLLGASGVDSFEGRKEDLQREELALILGELLRLGRATGVHVFVGTQRPDEAVMSGELKANLGTRIYMGTPSPQAAQAILGQKPAFGAGLLRTRGRAIMRIYGEEQVLFQANFLLMPPR